MMNWLLKDKPIVELSIFRNNLDLIQPNSKLFTRIVEIQRKHIFNYFNIGDRGPIDDMER
jgi:hypothetical protein